MKTKRMTVAATLVCILASAPLICAQALQNLFSFNGDNGSNPEGTLTLGSDGNFYGTTYNGGSHGVGTVFKITTNGTLTTLASFNGGNSTQPPLVVTNGANPQAGLTLGNDGNFYGTTSYGGYYKFGTVFKMTTNGILTTLVSFSGENGTNFGSGPIAGLILGGDGNFYGTTANGNSLDYGTVFKVTASGTLTTLVSFSGNNGENPRSGVTLAADGSFYGTTSYGSSSGVLYGSVFKVTSAGTLTTLAYFRRTDGAPQRSALTLGNDGNFYGTTEEGGNTNLLAGFGAGTVYQVTTNGMLTTLLSFNVNNGTFPASALALGNDGNFYGTTEYGGSSNDGTVFKVTPTGTLTTLVSFSGSNGANPYGGLTFGSDGNLYGTTLEGGTAGNGTVFRLSLPSVVRPTLALQISMGRPQLNLAGTLGNNYGFQYCTNLENPNWINLFSLTNLQTSPVSLFDPAGVVPSGRFYRAVTQ